MELLGIFLPLRNRPRNRSKKGFWLLNRTKKEPVKVLDPEKRTEEETGEGFWLCLLLDIFIDYNEVCFQDQLLMKRPRKNLLGFLFRWFSSKTQNLAKIYIF